MGTLKQVAVVTREQVPPQDGLYVLLHEWGHEPAPSASVALSLAEAEGRATADLARYPTLKQVRIFQVPEEGTAG